MNIDRLNERAELDRLERNHRKAIQEMRSLVQRLCDVKYPSIPERRLWTQFVDGIEQGWVPLPEAVAMLEAGLADGALPLGSFIERWRREYEAWGGQPLPGTIPHTLAQAKCGGM